MSSSPPDTDLDIVGTHDVAHSDDQIVNKRAKQRNSIGKRYKNILNPGDRRSLTENKLSSRLFRLLVLNVILIVLSPSTLLFGLRLVIRAA